VPDRSTRLAILASGAGSTLQALLDACADDTFGVTVVAVGADRPGTGALKRAEAAGVPTFVMPVEDYPTRLDWDRALTECVAGYRPDIVLSAGFLKLVGPQFLQRFGGRFLNSHPALLPAFPGLHAVRDALAYGVKVAGCTLFVVDAGIDSGPIVAQAVVPVLDDDDEQALHERIKAAERRVLVDSLARMARDGWTVSGRRVTIP
jgi:formyltetrahydrofolate-dependent phosphoribosylglycinamide formyltransferase